MKTVALSLFAVVATIGMGCATTDPDKLAAKHSEERIELADDQNKEHAAVDREQQEERIELAADQARENVNASEKGVKREVGQEAEQAKFAIDARERLAKFDARMAELRKLGKPVDESTARARNVIAARIDACDDEILDKQSWTAQRDVIKSELDALDNQIDRIEKNKQG
ncbi:MAG TPA: hypothetical protein VGF99_04260 [Myxococcota bacterium]